MGMTFDELQPGPASYQNAVVPALLIVDVQKDFCPGGALAVPDGDSVIEPLNIMIRHARSNGWLTVASRDWHPSNHCSFKRYGGIWPPHCVQLTPGAEFHSDLIIEPWFRELEVRKAWERSKDSYSAFDGSINVNWNIILTLNEILKKRRIDTLYVGGLATDYCVRATCLDGRKLGYAVYLLTDACRAVNVNNYDDFDRQLSGIQTIIAFLKEQGVEPTDENIALEEMRRAGVILTSVDEIVSGH